MKTPLWFKVDTVMPEFPALFEGSASYYGTPILTAQICR
jgi:hypothetical protein